MALSLRDKENVVAEVSQVAAKAHSVVGAEYRGLTVFQLTQMRKSAREANVYVRVVKNTLAKRAVEGTEFSCIKDSLTGPTILAFSLDDPGAAARVIADYAKSSDKLIPKVIALGGRAYGANELDRIANLPTREQAISMLMRTMLAPIEKFVRTLSEPHAKLVRTLAAVKESIHAA
jgi:large subunit ribosomal protein L10